MLKGGLSYRAKSSIALSLALLTLTVTVLFYSYIHQEQNFARHPRIIHTRHESIDTRSHGGIHPSGMLSNLRKLSMNALSFFSAPSAQLSRARSKPEDANAKQTFYFHFDHTLSSHDESIEQLEKIGVKLGRYIPQNTYLVTASPKQAEEAKENVKGLIWIGEMKEHHKLPKEAELRGHIDRHLAVSELREFESARMCHADTKEVLAGRKQLDTKGTEFLIHAHVAKHASKKELQQEIEAWEEEIRKEFPSVQFASLVVASKEKFALGVVGKDEAIDVMNWLSKKALVHWVELKPPVITHNKYAAMVTQSNSNPHSKPIWNMGISGQGQVIGVGDTGCDHYHCFFYDEHNPVPFQRNMRQDVADSKHRKFAGYWEFMDKLDSEGGHGSHVSGTASGNAPSYANPIVRDYSSLAKDSKLAFLDAGCDTDGGCSCPQDTQCECDLKANRLCTRKFGVVYLPLDLSEGYFPYFYSKNAKVASNSWGTGYYKDFSFGYSTSTSEIDQFVWDHKDFLPVFAAGNSGGQYGYASLTSESEAKNALVVGASQSSLESFQALANFTDYSRIIERIRSELYQAYCLDAPTSPLCEKAKAFTSMEQCCNDGGKCGGEVSTKCCGNQDFEQFPTLGFRCCDKCISFEMAHQAEHFSTNNLALFTARGPTMDGRIKPDIVTVGDKILSTKSLGTREDRKCNANQGESDILLKHEGTSMAAPNAAAAAVLVRQFFEDGFYPAGKPNPSTSVKPSASLVKGMLIHSAQLLTGYIYLMSKHVWWPLQYKPGHRFSLRQAYMQGFGRIELEQVMGPSSGLVIPNLVDKSISTGEMHNYCYYVKSSQKPFRVTLVWSDYPSTPVAKINLVNDLDLIIVGPDHKIYYGNGPKSVIESSRDEPDYLNNVEQILMTDVPPGHYNVIVRGTAIPKGPQTYSILISGDLEDAKSCNSIPAAVTAEVQKYMSLSVAMGVISVVFIPGFALLALYFYIQYRIVTTGARGYRESVMSKKGQGEYFGLEEEAADNVKPSAGIQPQPEFQLQN